MNNNNNEIGLGRGVNFNSSRGGGRGGHRGGGGGGGRGGGGSRTYHYQQQQQQGHNHAPSLLPTPPYPPGMNGNLDFNDHGASPPSSSSIDPYANSWDAPLSELDPNISTSDRNSQAIMDRDFWAKLNYGNTFGNCAHDIKPINCTCTRSRAFCCTKCKSFFCTEQCTKIPPAAAMNGPSVPPHPNSRSPPRRISHQNNNGGAGQSRANENIGSAGNNNHHRSIFHGSAATIPPHLQNPDSVPLPGSALAAASFAHSSSASTSRRRPNETNDNQRGNAPQSSSYGAAPPRTAPTNQDVDEPPYQSGSSAPPSAQQRGAYNNYNNNGVGSMRSGGQGHADVSERRSGSPPKPTTRAPTSGATPIPLHMIPPLFPPPPTSPVSDDPDDFRSAVSVTSSSGTPNIGVGRGRGRKLSESPSSSSTIGGIKRPAVYDQLPYVIGSNADVTLCWVADPSEIFVCRVSDLPKLTEIEELINSIPAWEPLPLSATQKGEVCMAYFESTDSDEASGLYRAKIIQAYGNSGTVKVQYVDYGNSSEVERGSLKRMPAQLLNKPSLASRIIFKQICPSNNQISWSDAATNYFKEMTQQKLCHFTPTESGPDHYFGVLGVQGDDGQLVTHDICEDMIRLGFADAMDDLQILK